LFLPNGNTLLMSRVIILIPVRIELRKFILLMRATISIFFLVLLVLTQTPVAQLARLPFLVQHFNKHKKQTGVSLLQFLGDHYSPDHNDGDRSEDEQLPFKTIVLQTIGFAIVPAIVKTDVPVSFKVLAKTTLPDFYTPQQHLCSIFHPPRQQA
jgi:hypothetical protein